MKFKKIISTLLIITMIFCMTFTHFAEDNNQNNDESVAKIENEVKSVSLNEINASIIETKEDEDKVQNNQDESENEESNKKASEEVIEEANITEIVNNSDAKSENQNDDESAYKNEDIVKDAENSNETVDKVTKNDIIEMKADNTSDEVTHATNSDIDSDFENEEVSIATSSIVENALVGDPATNEFKYVFTLDWNLPEGVTMEHTTSQLALTGDITSDNEIINNFQSEQFENDEYYIYQWTSNKDIPVMTRILKNSFDRISIPPTEDELSSSAFYSIESTLKFRRNEGLNLLRGFSYTLKNFGKSHFLYNPDRVSDETYQDSVWNKYQWYMYELNSVEASNLSISKWCDDNITTNNTIEISLKANWKKKNLHEFTIHIDPNLPEGTTIDEFLFDGLSIDTDTTSMTATYDIWGTEYGLTEPSIGWDRNFSDGEISEKADDFSYVYRSLELDSLDFDFAGYWTEKLPIINAGDRYYDDLFAELAEKNLTDSIPTSKFKNDQITLYAVWEKETSEYDYRFHFSVDDKYIYHSQFLNVGDKVTKPKDPTKDNKVFDGWYYKNNEGKEVKWNFDKVLSENDNLYDVELYAKWTDKRSNPIPPSGGNSSPSSGNGGSSSSSVGPIKPGPKSQPNVTVAKADKARIEKTFRTEDVRWSYDAMTNKWKLGAKNADGSSVALANGFFQVNWTLNYDLNGTPTNREITDTYYFDESGNMVTGWVQTGDNKWYYFENANTAEQGKMQFGWKQVGNYWFYFGDSGAMLSGTTTPDGYTVDSDGRWITNDSTIKIINV